ALHSWGCLIQRGFLVSAAPPVARCLASLLPGLVPYFHPGIFTFAAQITSLLVHCNRKYCNAQTHPNHLGLRRFLSPYRRGPELALRLGSIDHNFGGTLAELLD